MSERNNQRDVLNELLEALGMSDGCATFLAGALVVVVLVAGVALLWSGCRACA